MTASNLLRAVNRTVAGLLGQRRGIVYVTDSSVWAFHWYAHYLTRGIHDRFGTPVSVTQDPWSLRNQIIHFGDRYAFFDGPRERLHPSNEIFLTWFHGNDDDPNPDMKRLLGELPEAVEGLRGLVVSCEISRNVLVERGVDPAKISLIPLGVDTAKFTPPDAARRAALRAEIGIPPDSVCIGSFQKDGAGWGAGDVPKWVKGPDVFLQTVGRLKEHHRNLFVLLTGPARGYVVRGLERIGVPCVHRFVKDYLDIARYYQALDLYLITSRSEGGPLALLESWASGVPVVSTRVGMSADIIRHGENGMLAEIEDDEALARCAAEILDSTEHANTLRTTALADAAAYDWSRIAEAHFKALYAPFF
jgi:glycosyltransferase involved in cell wall biosynthesis